MPGSVANATPLTVMPWSLSTAFARTQEWPVALNEYRGAEAQRKEFAASTRLSWALQKALPASELATLLEFWRDRGGPMEPFYFYDPLETSPAFHYDPTGVSTVGRYTVRFDGAWESVTGIARSRVALKLVQLA